MYHLSKPLFLLCETPMHAGSGDDLGVVDLPIQRERHTGFPKIEGSSLKGALREAFETALLKKEGKTRKQIIEIKEIATAFGPDEGLDGAGDTQAACLGFTDARLLLFPVKSMRGVFVWATCPMVLDRLEQDLQHCNPKAKVEGIPADEDGVAYVLDEKNIAIDNKVVLEEFAFSMKKAAIKIGDVNLGEWLADTMFGATNSYRKGKMTMDIVILSNTDFKNFTTRSTEIVTRTKINNETGTVQNGALFTEEFLPTESLMYSLVLASPEFKKEDQRHEKFRTAEDTSAFFADVLNNHIKNVVQIGGDATIGKGIVKAKFKQQI